MLSRKRPAVQEDPVTEIHLESPPTVRALDGTSSLPLTRPMLGAFRNSLLSTGTDASMPSPGRASAGSAIAAACEAACLDTATAEAVACWAQTMGAVACSELVSGSHFEKLVEAVGLKPFEAERLEKELRGRRNSILFRKASKTSHGPTDSTATHKSGRCTPRMTHMRADGVGRPRKIIFIRHGESEANVDRNITVWVPDHSLHLTTKGRFQALNAGNRLRELLGDDLRRVCFVVSPYVRARETLNGILHAFPDTDPQVLMDVRIREQEFGNFDRPDISQLHKEKSAFGAFYYRFPDGESPADCYDRGTMFLEHLLQTWDASMSTCVIVSHGMMISVMLMRVLGYPVDEFDTLGPLQNCEFVVLERQPQASAYDVAFTWSEDSEKDHSGLKRIEPRRPPPAIWDGNPQAIAMVSKPRKSVIDVVNMAHIRVSAANGHLAIPMAGPMMSPELVPEE